MSEKTYNYFSKFILALWQRPRYTALLGRSSMMANRSKLDQEV